MRHLSFQRRDTLRAFATALTVATFTFSAVDTVNAEEELGVIEMSLGAEDAPVTLYEYASFTCPHCAEFHADQFKKLKADYIETGRVRFVFREVYFDKFGVWASVIARCGGPDKFFGLTDLMFKSQATWARQDSEGDILEELKKAGRLAGLDDTTMNACLLDKARLQQLIKWYQTNATQDKIRSTPSLVLDGENLGNPSYDALRAALDEKLGE